MIELMNKVCTACELEKPVSDFSSKKSRCKLCVKIYDLERRYGLTQEIYDHMLRNQNYSCAICSTHIDEAKMLVVDHDHLCCPGEKTCGLCIRSLLCSACNTGLGLFRDNVELLRRAYEYLENFKYKGRNIDQIS